MWHVTRASRTQTSWPTIRSSKRLLWWQAWQQKLDGMLYWGANIWERRGNTRPIDPSRGPLLEWGVTTGKSRDEIWPQQLHGDGLLIYPAKDGPIGSIR